MSAWGTKRRNRILFVIFLLIAIPVVVIFFAFFYETPTCFDGRQNGNEKGVDCGGSCSLLCQNQTVDPFVKWERYFEVGPGFYNVVAYVENQNPDAGTQMLQYKFTLYDTENAIIAEREGRTRVRAKEIIPIVENVLNTGKIEATRMTFEITNDIIWQVEKPRDNSIFITDEKIFTKDGSTRVTGVINNNSLKNISDVTTVVLLYDKNDNAIGASSTFVEQVQSGDFAEVTFTWPKIFSEQIIRFEIIPLYESA